MPSIVYVASVSELVNVKATRFGLMLVDLVVERPLLSVTVTANTYHVVSTLWSLVESRTVREVQGVCTYDLANARVAEIAAALHEASRSGDPDRARTVPV